jgi:DNA-binding MarR family transcriptional regulator
MEFNESTIRIGKLARKLNISISDIVKHLKKIGYDNIDSNPNQKITNEMLTSLLVSYDNLPDKTTQRIYRRMLLMIIPPIKTLTR